MSFFLAIRKHLEISLPWKPKKWFVKSVTWSYQSLSSLLCAAVINFVSSAYLTIWRRKYQNGMWVTSAVLRKVVPTHLTPLTSKWCAVITIARIFLINSNTFFWAHKSRRTLDSAGVLDQIARDLQREWNKDSKRPWIVLNAIINSVGSVNQQPMRKEPAKFNI